MRGHCYDALVGLAGCDKSLPGMMMAMVRLNVPSVFMYGGSILPGRFHGQDVTVRRRVRGGRRSTPPARCRDEDLHELECVACPSAGSCGGQFTANTMACVSEAIGLALPGSAGAPAPYEIARRLRRGVGRGGDGAAREATSARATSSPARRWRTRRMVVAATGGSTNGGAASAGDRARGRHRVRPARRRRDLPEDALHRRPEAGRQIRRQGHVRGRRRAGR